MVVGGDKEYWLAVITEEEDRVVDGAENTRGVLFPQSHQGFDFVGENSPRSKKNKPYITNHLSSLA